MFSLAQTKPNCQRALVRILLVAMGAAASMTAVHADDPAAGEHVFRKCVACHAVGEGARNKVGPHLNGIFGREAGSVAGYNYSDAIENSGIVWEEGNFAEYVRNPREFMPGTKMAFAGLRDDQEISDVIAYLKQFDAEGNQAALDD
jgi:cytochrome c